MPRRKAIAITPIQNSATLTRLKAKVTMIKELLDVLKMLSGPGAQQDPDSSAKAREAIGTLLDDLLADLKLQGEQSAPIVHTLKRLSPEEFDQLSKALGLDGVANALGLPGAPETDAYPTE